VVRLRLTLLAATAGVLAAAGLFPTAVGTSIAQPRPPTSPASPGPTVPTALTVPTVPTATVRPRRAPVAPAGLAAIDYWTAPRGFPADPTPLSIAPIAEGLHPSTALAVYDAPGGTPRGRLTPAISGMPLVAPIVGRRAGWVAVLLPTTNRTIGWLPAGGWATRPLRDRLVLQRRTHRLTWLHDEVRSGVWTVTTGTAATPTPLGRTFVLGRTSPRGDVYAGLDALVLAGVPDDLDAVAASLFGAHTGIHSWYRDDTFGRNASNGCVRVPPAGQRVLLNHITAGTTLTVVD
jgi:L,D-transpeptidase-like protein